MGERLKTITIADFETGEVLESVVTEESVDDIIETLTGSTDYGICFFESKESFDKANNS